MTSALDPETLARERDNLKKILNDINAKYLEKIEELSLIRRIGDALKDITDFPSVCRSIVSIIQQELDPDNCSLMTVSDELGELTLQAAKGPYDREAVFIEPGADTTRFRIGEAVAGEAARTGSSISIQDVREDERFVVRKAGSVDIRSLISVPLVAGERVIAVLNLSHADPGAFAPETERILSIIANSSAAALENTRLYEKIKESRDRLARENVDLKNELKKKFSRENIIGTSDCFSEILKKVERVAGLEVNVLITGESGTGKELIARTLHYTSSRAAGPLVSVNCAALPENLLESELFGIEKGVATGVEKRQGKFELASGGTVFLDEVGDMSLATQARILRVLQERELQRVGGSKTISIDVRVIAATNRKLEEMIAEGTFREDLYYRLKVIEIRMPALRERPGDIPLLANHFLKNACRRHGLGEKWFSQNARNALCRAAWKGNVRELENVIEQAAILSPGEAIRPEDLALASVPGSAELSVSIPENVLDYHDALQQVSEAAERIMVERALARTGSNKTQAARLLGISRRTLMYKVGKMGI